MTNGVWQQILQLKPRNYTCGHSNCGREVGSDKGYLYQNRDSGRAEIFVYVCPVCHRPTFFDYSTQIPGVSIGHDIDHLPQEIAGIYNEVRKSTSQESFTLAVLGCRKLLMHIAVEKGAKENLSFVEYVNYLADNHYAPPNSQPWVDRIRQKGNEVNHEIKIMTKDDALEIINFIEMLLKFIYEFPGKAGV